MIGIIGAMEEEVKALLDKTEDIHENKILDCVFYEGKIDNKQVVILQGGIGKVNSAICVTLLLTNYDIEYVINIGSAGGLKDYQNVGDVVISSHVSYHDVDLTALGVLWVNYQNFLYSFLQMKIWLIKQKIFFIK